MRVMLTGPREGPRHEGTALDPSTQRRNFSMLAVALFVAISLAITTLAGRGKGRRRHGAGLVCGALSPADSANFASR